MTVATLKEEEETQPTLPRRYPLYYGEGEGGGGCPDHFPSLISTNLAKFKHSSLGLLS